MKCLKYQILADDHFGGYTRGSSRERARSEERERWEWLRQDLRGEVTPLIVPLADMVLGEVLEASQGAVAWDTPLVIG